MSWATEGTKSEPPFRATGAQTSATSSALEWAYNNGIQSEILPALESDKRYLIHAITAVYNSDGEHGRIEILQYIHPSDGNLDEVVFAVPNSTNISFTRPLKWPVNKPLMVKTDHVMIAYEVGNA